MTDDNIQSYIDDILDALSDDSDKKVSREELEKEFKKFLEYGVPVEHAKQTLIKKFRGDTERPMGERIPIADIQPDKTGINLLCRVININSREITSGKEKRKIFYGILGDESGTIGFTAWKDFNIEKGDILEISNAYAREWQGNIRINLGERTRIEKTDEEKLAEISYKPREYKIRDLRSGLGAVELIVKILDIKKREVEVDGSKKSVYSGIFGDETGKAQFTSWHDFDLKKGDVIRVSGGYVKTWRGIPQLIFDEKATVEKLDSNKILTKDIKTQKIPIHELVERHGGLDVMVEGTVIEIREGSGIITRCPKCSRVIQDQECSVHGRIQDGLQDIRVKLVIDDGTGSINAILGREVTEKLLGKTLDEWKKTAEKTKNKDTVIEEIKNMLFAHTINIQGNALSDEYGTTIIAKNAEFADIDINNEFDNLYHELEEEIQ